MSEELSAKNLREKAKEIAEQRRADRRRRKRTCVVCGVDESEKSPFIAHVDGIGPSCKEEQACLARRANR